MKGRKGTNKLLKGLSQKRGFYEQVARTKGDMDEYWATGFCQSLLVEKINHILNNVHGQRIVDVGCGDGRTALYLLKRKNSVIGIDISYARLSRAKQKARKYKHRVLFVQSYAETLPAKHEIFDGVVCMEVLEHVTDDDVLLREMFSILKPNAWMLMSIPTVSLSRYFDMRYTKRLIYFDPVEHVREFSYFKIPPFENDFILVKDLVKKLKSFGLTIKKSYGIGFELPLGVRRFRIGGFLEKLCRNKRVNRFIMRLPILKKFRVYTILVLKKIPQLSDDTCKMDV
jgi:2-polyprenyl-3-methyl-5-hydroxy-6-metoxy-1,4-benzoquinol methylase